MLIKGDLNVDKWKEFINKKDIRLIDHTNIHQFDMVNYEALTSFAIDDSLAMSVGEYLSPLTIRLWIHDNTVVLGTPDSRMPYIEEGLNFLRSNQQNVVIRNSGGLAVALDSGVLNLSLILPNSNQVSIHTGYDIMTSFIKNLLKDYTTEIQAYEIVGSYCPGDYDLSIDGIKFAGISQRRVKNGVSVQIYLDINGRSNARANLIKEFYAISLKDAETKTTFPKVNPAVMGSLSEILNEEITVQDILIRLTKLTEINMISPSENHFTQTELNQFHKRLEQMYKRNERIRTSNNANQSKI